MTRSRPVLPYRVLPLNAVAGDAEGWAVIVEGQVVSFVTDGSVLPAWDAQLAFSLRRTFTVAADAERGLGLNTAGSGLAIAVIASSAGGVVREVMCQQRLPRDGSAVTLVIDPPSDRLAKDLLLTTGVYLLEGGASDALAAKLPGSRLWEMRERIRLEGGAVRLPMYEVSFARAFPGSKISRADFHVEVVDEPDIELESAVAVYLNSDLPEMVAAIARAGSDAERHLWTGIIRRVLESAVLKDACVEGATGESGSLGATVGRWVGQVWPSTPFKDVRDLMIADPSRFEAQIESWLRDVVAPLMEPER